MPNFIDRANLLDPGMDASGGGTAAPAAPAPSATPSVPSTGNAPSPAPAASTASAPPQGMRMIPDAEYQQLRTYEGKARASDAIFNRAKQLGAKSFDDVMTGFERHQRISADESLKGIVDAIMAGAPATPSVPGSQQSNTGQPFDTNQLPALVQEQVARALESRDRAVLEREHASLMQQENNLLASSVSDARFKPLFGDTNFDDAFAGKGSKSATLVATLMDRFVADVADKYPDGRLKPISDPAKMQKVMDMTYDALKELRAGVLMQASSNGTENISSAGTRSAPVPQGESPREGSIWPSEEKVNATFQNSYKAALAGSIG